MAVQLAMDRKGTSVKVMIAGIGGASLGTEIRKSLSLAECYDIYGCDISSTAYGLYEKEYAGTYRIRLEGYVDNVIEACQNAGAKWLIPGGEQPTILLSDSYELLQSQGITVVANSPEVVSLFSDKESGFKRLAECGIPVPKTIALRKKDDVDAVGIPCIVKPATGSGGSVSVFFASSHSEANIYAGLIRLQGGRPLAQEYIGTEEGEFTVGVLSLPDGTTVGSIALRRDLNSKLSVAFRGRGGLISSGYSQGRINTYPEVCIQAERIAAAIGSRGPINIQARLRDGILLPFEINPRFSASTYLRALAGFNEVDLFLKYLVFGETPCQPRIIPGWYLRTLCEQYVPNGNLK